RVLAIDPKVLDSLPEDERTRVDSMLNEVLEVYEIDEYNQAWVDKRWERGEDCMESHSLGLSAAEMELVSDAC
ncbi:MAG: hypothetical protein PVJ17_07910, partial [Lysobacterales bacterium]